VGRAAASLLTKRGFFCEGAVMPSIRATAR
jgi:hypothetical protein